MPKHEQYALLQEFVDTILANFRFRAQEEWKKPHQSYTPHDAICLEWWKDARKLTVYANSNMQLDYVKVWGPDMDSDMEVGKIDEWDDFTELWAWLLEGT